MDEKEDKRREYREIRWGKGGMRNRKDEWKMEWRGNYKEEEDGDTLNIWTGIDEGKENEKENRKKEV